MKLATFLIVLICTAEFGTAQDQAIAGTAAKEATIPQQTDRAHLFAPQVQVDPSTHARSAPNAASTILVETKPTADPAKTTRRGRSVIADWREHVFKSLSMSLTPDKMEEVPSGGLLSQTQINEQAREKRTATRIVLRETLNYARGQVPELDMLVRALKFEISNRPKEHGTAPVSKTNLTGAQPAAVARGPEDKLYVKTGLRLPVENRKVCIVSESEAQYGNLTSFLEVNLDGTYDRKAGLTYLLGSNARLQVARYVTHEDTLFTNDGRTTRTSLNTVQLIVIF